MKPNCCYKCERKWKGALCHCYCPIYKTQSMEREKEKNRMVAQKSLEEGLYKQREKGVLKANKRKRNTKKYSQ